MALKVFDLACEHDHVFEGWFRSQEDYEKQRQEGWVSCPVCHSTEVSKKLSAPRLNLRHGASGRGEVASTSPTASSAMATEHSHEMQAKFLQQLKQAIRNTDDVGSNFAQEARKIHEGEAPERAIRGSATFEEYESLRDEGIHVLAIPEYLDEDKLN